MHTLRRSRWLMASLFVGLAVFSQALGQAAADSPLVTAAGTRP